MNSKSDKNDKPTTSANKTGHTQSNQQNLEQGFVSSSSNYKGNNQSQIHNQIHNSNNDKGLEYIRDELRERNLTIKEKDSYIKELHKRNLNTASYAMLAVSTVLTSVVIVLNRLDEEKKASQLSNNATTQKKENLSNGKNKKISQSNRKGIEMQPGQGKKAQPFTRLRMKESFVDTVKRLVTTRTKPQPLKESGVSKLGEQAESDRGFEVNEVLEGFVAAKPLGEVQGMNAPKMRQVFRKGESIVVGVDFERLGGEEVTLSVLGASQFSDPIFSVELSGQGISKVRLPKLGIGIWYLQVRKTGIVLGASKFVIR